MGMTYDDNYDATTEPQCKILGIAGFFVQAALAILSFGLLLIKRHFETPKRTWKVWMFDNSKQVFSALLQHSLNMILAVYLSRANAADDCEWYFLNFACDIFLGVTLCYIGIKTVENIGVRYHIDELNTGVYTTSESEVDYKVLIIQMAVWGMIVSLVKILLFFFQLIFSIPLEFFSEITLGWLNAFPTVKLILIMMVIPLLFNGLQFWIQDNILKSKEETSLKFMSSGALERAKSLNANRTSGFDSVLSTKKSSSFVTSIHEKV